MAEHLLSKNYEVYGTVRNNSNLSYLNPILNKICLITGDLTNIDFLYKSLIQSNPDEIYHFASISSNIDIWANLPYTYKNVGEIVLNFLEAIKLFNKNIKFLNCSSSEIYGENIGLINENTAKNPKTPYGIAKYFALKNVELYREKFGLFAVNAICFNHESERRNANFVTRKISQNVVNIKSGLIQKIQFGNIQSFKDWSYAPEFISAMYKMMEHKEPEDFILSSGKLVSVSSIIEHSFNYLNIDNWKNFVISDINYEKDRISNQNYGDASKALQILNWKTKLTIFEVIELMIEFDLKNKV